MFIMKKSLLLMAFGLLSAASSFALEQGEFVYTPQGRFQITGANINANSAFNDFTGWTLISASAEKTIADQFNQNGNGYAEGINSAQSLDATAGEGMYFKFEPSDAASAYVVSFKLKGPALSCIENRIPGDGNKRGDNLVKVAGNSAHEFGVDTLDYVCVNTAEELTEEWQTFNYAIVGDGIARTYFISFQGMNTSIELADLQIAPALQYADLRQRDAMLERLYTYRDCFNWPEDVLADFAVTETIQNLEAIGDESGQADLDEQLSIAQEVIDEFLKENMDDYFASNSDNYFTTWVAKWQKVSTIGEWNCLPSGRGFWENASQGAIDLGHYAGNTAWNFGSVDDPMGVYMQKVLDPGSYVFSIEGSAAVREDATSTSWTNNEAWDVAYGVAYVVKVNEGADPDTIASVVKGLDSRVYTRVTLSLKIEEGATYEIGFKAYCKDAYKDLKNGSVLYLKDASLWGKNNNKYNQKQLGYEADVLEQIAAGRTNITTADEYIDNPAYLWGKAELQACIDTVEVKIAEYELLTQDDIIDTFDGDIYVKSTSSEDGLLVYKVYTEATRDIIAANRKFLAVNDTLNSIQTAIDGAEATLALRVYSASTGRDKLLAAIATAKDVQAAMKATDYSEQNAAVIVDAIKELNAAVDEFRVIPASAFTTLVDIDFEQDAVLNDETALYQIAGAAGTMVFSRFSPEGPTTEMAQPFQQGHWSNGEQLYKGYVRVGNGDGTVEFEPGDMGTDIMRVNFDFFLQGLNGRNVGFFLTAPTDSTDVTVASYYANYYNGTIDATSTLPIELSNLQFASGGNYNNAAPEGADSTATYVCAKNSFEVILDFGEGSVYATTTSAKGTVMTAKQEFNKVAPNKFILRCNYNNDDRRVWFDNLKIQRITAGAANPWVDGIQEVNEAAKVVVPTKVFRNGRIVINGKYGINGVIVK